MRISAWFRYHFNDTVSI